MLKKIKISNSEKLHKKAKKIIPYGAQTYSKGVKAFSDGVSPKFLAKGMGCEVWDVDGNKFIDYAMGAQPLILGYADRDVNNAVKKQLELGNIEIKRDFTYVSDTVDGYISAIGNKKCIGETIQLGTGIDFSMRETFENIKKIIGKNVKVVKDKNRMRPKMSEVNRLISSNKKAKKILKWKPKYSGKNGFIKGLKETVEWFDDSKNLSQYKSKLYNY